MADDGRGVPRSLPGAACFGWLALVVEVFLALGARLLWRGEVPPGAPAPAVPAAAGHSGARIRAEMDRTYRR